MPRSPQVAMKLIVTPAIDLHKVLTGFFEATALTSEADVRRFMARRA
ncbi:hypothetical protein MHL40_15960 [Pseudomonas luteola]|nr:hypothetical protein [Pseudomonas luteola]MCG7374153.1 hypothetical protein [Pseudomonas luteola]